MSPDLLAIEDLGVDFDTDAGVLRALEGVNLRLSAGETLCLVGESGCGKSVTALSVLGLIPSPPGRIRSGRILFQGKNLLAMNFEALHRIRGCEIAMIFQEPMTSLNPVMTIGRQVAEPLMVHKNLPRRAAYAEAANWLAQVRIPAAQKRLNDYPHQLSGGMRQRVMIAMAMACRPQVLIADEPTTALDVTIQARILALMEGLKQELGMAMLLITHDMGVVAQMAHRVAVMYAGQVIETAMVADLFAHPFHPYSQGLLNSVPRLGDPSAGGTLRLQEIPGRVPVLGPDFKGCRFADRCIHVFDRCRQETPILFDVGERQQARCWLHPCPRRRQAHAG